MPKLTRRSRILIMIALGVIVLLLAGPRLIDAYVDWLWFGELGYRSVFTTMLATRIVVCLVAGVVVGGIVFGGLALAYRTRPGSSRMPTTIRLHGIAPSCWHACG